MAKKPQYQIIVSMKGTGPYTLLQLVPGKLLPGQEITNRPGVYHMDNGLEVRLRLNRKGWAMSIKASKRWQQDLLRGMRGRKLWRLLDEDGDLVATYDPIKDQVQGQQWAGRRLRLAGNPYRQSSRPLQGGAPGLRQQRRR